MLSKERIAELKMYFTRCVQKGSGGAKVGTSGMMFHTFIMSQCLEYCLDGIPSRSLSTVVHLAECGLELIEMVEALQQENEQLKEQINTAKIGWDTYKTYSEQLEQQTAESNKIIEIQRQEIKKLKATLADRKYNTI